MQQQADSITLFREKLDDHTCELTTAAGAEHLNHSQLNWIQIGLLIHLAHDDQGIQQKQWPIAILKNNGIQQNSLKRSSGRASGR